MRAPWDVSGLELARALRRVGYQETRQTGSHLRLTNLEPTEHHVTVPLHNPLKVGTLNAILTDVATHLAISREELLRRLFS
jgi:predicted RNA binding protein YcfA (HicA-like mRNA interferase family)